MARPDKLGLLDMRSALLALLLLSLAGCGFRPLYGSPEQGRPGVETQLADILVLPISERAGQQLHNYLRNALNPGGQPADPSYRLRVQVTESSRELGVQRDATASRANLTLRADFSLHASASDKVLFRGRASSVNSYDILDLEIQFSTVVSREDARARGLEQLATAIKTRLAIFLQSGQG